MDEILKISSIGICGCIIAAVLKNQKSELNSIIVYSIILGISVNIISGILSEIFDIPLWLNLIIWVGISFGVIVILQIIKLHKLKTKIKFDCLFIADESQKNKLIGIPNYKISTDMKKYFEFGIVIR